MSDTAATVTARQPSIVPESAEAAAASSADDAIGSPARTPGPAQTTLGAGAGAPAKTRSSCTIKKRAKIAKDTPKERLLCYRLDLQKAILNDAIGALKEIQVENQKLKEKRDECLSDQQDLFCDAKFAIEELERKKTQEDDLTQQQIDEISKFIWAREKRNDTIVRKMKNSIQRMESEISRKEQNNDWLRTYRDNGRFQHEHRITSLKEQRSEANSYFKKLSDRMTLQALKEHEEIDHATSAAIANNQCAATENSISKMTRSDQIETMENLWLRGEITVYREIVESLLSETENLTGEVLCLIKEVHLRAEEELKLPRRSSMHQFSIMEDLCEDLTSETDTWTTDEANPPTADPEDKTKCRERNSDGLHYDDDPDKENKYLNRAPVELQFLKIYGRRLTFPPQTTTSADGESGQIAVPRIRTEELSHSWPVTWDMLKRFREQLVTEADIGVPRVDLRST